MGTSFTSSKRRTCCGAPSSTTVKSSFFKPSTGWPRPSTTEVKSSTNWTSTWPVAPGALTSTVLSVELPSSR